MQPTSFRAGKVTHSEVGGAHTQFGSLQLVTVQDSAKAGPSNAATLRTIASVTTADATTKLELLFATM